jgi:hypothetical protein
LRTEVDVVGAGVLGDKVDRLVQLVREPEELFFPPTLCLLLVPVQTGEAEETGSISKEIQKEGPLTLQGFLVQYKHMFLSGRRKTLATNPLRLV